MPKTTTPTKPRGRAVVRTAAGGTTKVAYAHQGIVQDERGQDQPSDKQRALSPPPPGKAPRKRR